jgi:hypothetical protein
MRRQDGAVLRIQQIRADTARLLSLRTEQVPKIHSTSGLKPAMEAVVADHVWELEEWVAPRD